MKIINIFKHFPTVERVCGSAVKLKLWTFFQLCNPADALPTFNFARRLLKSKKILINVVWISLHVKNRSELCSSSSKSQKGRRRVLSFNRSRLDLNQIEMNIPRTTGHNERLSSRSFDWDSRIRFDWCGEMKTKVGSLDIRTKLAKHEKFTQMSSKLLEFRPSDVWDTYWMTIY